MLRTVGNYFDSTYNQDFIMHALEIFIIGIYLAKSFDGEETLCSLLRAHNLLLVPTVVFPAISPLANKIFKHRPLPRDHYPTSKFWNPNPMVGFGTYGLIALFGKSKVVAILLFAIPVYTYLIIGANDILQVLFSALLASASFGVFSAVGDEFLVFNLVVCLIVSVPGKNAAIKNLGYVLFDACITNFGTNLQKSRMSWLNPLSAFASNFMCTYISRMISAK